MTAKLDLYDILSALVPGLILVSWIPVCFPVLLAIPAPHFPDAFAVLALTAVALALGQLVQALASAIEPVLNWSWGGRPSELALKKGLGDRYLPHVAAQRIRESLAAAMGGEPSERHIFLYAMNQTDSAGHGRAARFNELYAYHRSLLVLALLLAVALAASATWGSAATLNVGVRRAAVGGFVLLVPLVWQRTRQRAYYYVREVLLTAERGVDQDGRNISDLPQTGMRHE